MTLDEGDCCSEYKTRDAMCRVMTKDPFHTRGQCAWCFAHKSGCSIKFASKKDV